MFLYGNFALKPLSIGDIMSNNNIMQFSYFYWHTNEKKADEKRPHFTMESAILRYCVMLLEKRIVGYYSIVV